MPTELRVPRLGWSMEEGTFVRWLKQDGDRVAQADPLFEIEGEKATEEIAAPAAGILRISPHAPKPGEVVPVGALLAYLASDAEAVQFDEPRPFPAAAAPTAPPTGAAIPAAGAARAGRPVSASPRARRAAAERGVDWTKLAGSGRGGRVRERDVLAAQSGRLGTGAIAAGAAGSATPAAGPGHTLPISRLRRAIAAHLAAGHREAVPVTLTTRADATNLVSLRSQFKAAAPAGGVVPGYTDFLVKLAAEAMREHSALAAQWRGEALYVPDRIDVAIAVEAGDCLMAPVLRDVPSLTLREVACARALVVERAREGKLAAHELEGGALTITNLGNLGVDAFTPALNLPQSAIVGVGRILREPAVVGTAVVPRDMMWLSLTFDHRVVDGAPAARFLDALRRSVENPAPYLLG